MLTARNRLRDVMLSDALSHPQSMHHLTSFLAHSHIVESDSAQHELALQAIRSLLEDGFIEIGDRTPEGKLARWDLPVDAVMERVNDRFAGQDDAGVSEFWFGLTRSGRDLAREMTREPT